MKRISRRPQQFFTSRNNGTKEPVRGYAVDLSDVAPGFEFFVYVSEEGHFCCEASTGVAIVDPLRALRYRTLGDQLGYPSNHEAVKRAARMIKRSPARFAKQVRALRKEEASV